MRERVGGDGSGALQPCFVTIANGPVDVAKVRAGNEAVLRARYEDAAFFHRADLKDPTIFNLLQVGDVVAFELIDDRISGARAIHVVRSGLRA